MRQRVPPALPPDAELARRMARTPLLIALDVDGTLAPIAPIPSAAAVPEGTRNTIARIAARDGLHVAFVTGRAAAEAQRMLASTDFWFLGNHGMERVAPGGEERVDERLAPYVDQVAETVRAIDARTSDIRGVIVEDKRWSATIHYRLVHRDDVSALRSIVRDEAGKRALRITPGKKIFELRPPVDIHKGTALMALAEELGVLEGGTVFYAGDDRTDEDAFEVLRRLGDRAVTVRVGKCEGDDETDAEWLVDDTYEMSALLEWIAAGAPAM